MKNIEISVRLPNYKNKVNIHHLYGVKLLLMALVEKFMAYDWIGFIVRGICLSLELESDEHYH